MKRGEVIGYIEIAKDIEKAAERLLAEEYPFTNTTTAEDVQGYVNDARRVAKGLLDVIYTNKAA